MVEAVERGPTPAIHGVVRWRLIDLAHWLYAEFAVSLDETTVSSELKKLGYVKLTARPRHHAQNEMAMEALKKRGFASALAEKRFDSGSIRVHRLAVLSPDPLARPHDARTVC